MSPKVETFPAPHCNESLKVAIMIIFIAVLAESIRRVVTTEEEVKIYYANLPTQNLIRGSERLNE
jgi:hypothetical protein